MSPTGTDHPSFVYAPPPIHAIPCQRAEMDSLSTRLDRVNYTWVERPLVFLEPTEGGCFVLLHGPCRALYVEQIPNLDPGYPDGGIYIEVMPAGDQLLLECQAYEPVGIGRRMLDETFYACSGQGYAEAKAVALCWLSRARSLMERALGLVDEDARRLFRVVTGLEGRRQTNPDGAVSTPSALARVAQWYVVEDGRLSKTLDVERVQRALLWLYERQYVVSRGEAPQLQWFTREWLEGRIQGHIVK